MLLPKFGPLELMLILVIVAMLFGVGKLPEVFGAVGKGVKEFRRNANDADSDTAATPAAAAPVVVADKVVVTDKSVQTVNGQAPEASDVSEIKAS
jgi:sec-independent protein translocase protein TatA